MHVVSCSSVRVAHPLLEVCAWDCSRCASSSPEACRMNSSVAFPPACACSACGPRDTIAQEALHAVATV